MTTTELEKQYTARATAERSGGGQININRTLGTISLTMSNGDEYYFDGDNADELLRETPEWSNDEDYILAQAQNW